MYRWISEGATCCVSSDEFADDQRRDDADNKKKVVQKTFQEQSRIDEKPCHDKKDRDEKRVGKKLQLVLPGFAMNRRVHCQPCEESPNDAGKVHKLRQNTRHRHHPEQQYEVEIGRAHV